MIDKSSEFRNHLMTLLQAAGKGAKKALKKAKENTDAHVHDVYCIHTYIHACIHTY